MKKVSLNQNSWHFKYYSTLVSEQPPRSLCPYFWTMVFLVVVSPLVLVAYCILKPIRLLTDWYYKKFPSKKLSDYETYAEYRRAKQKKKERWLKFWSVMADIARILGIGLAVFGLGFLCYQLYRQVVDHGILSFLIALLIMAGLIGIVVLVRWTTEKLLDWLDDDNVRTRIKKFFRALNPFNWKVVKITAVMIKATYTRMCPLIDWKNTTSILLLLMMLTSCTRGKYYPYEVYTANGSGWNLSRSIMHCDSVKLYTPKHGVIYRDGVATEVYAERILISTN